jgi:hypothetical protein
MKPYHDTPSERDPKREEENDGLMDEELDGLGARVLQDVLVRFPLL